jgi:hypothetical protein
VKVKKLHWIKELDPDEYVFVSGDDDDDGNSGRSKLGQFERSQRTDILLISMIFHIQKRKMPQERRPNSSGYIEI